MQEYYIDAHSVCCKSQLCAEHPKRFILFLHGKFMIITHHSCMTNRDHVAWRRSIVHVILQNHCKDVPHWEVNTGVNVDKELRDWRIRNASLRKFIQQAHYLYYNNSRRAYAITSTIPFIEAITNFELITREYEEAMNYLIAYGLDGCHGKELNELYHVNTMPAWQAQAQHVKSIEHLINIINNHGKQEKSKHR